MSPPNFALPRKKREKNGCRSQCMGTCIQSTSSPDSHQYGVEIVSLILYRKRPRGNTTSSPGHFSLARVTAFWASPGFGHPHSLIPSVLGIPFSYYCSVLGIPRYPPGMPKSLAFWASPPKQFGISRENRKPFRDGFR